LAESGITGATVGEKVKDICMVQALIDRKMKVKNDSLVILCLMCLRKSKNLANNKSSFSNLASVTLRITKHDSNSRFEFHILTNQMQRSPFIAKDRICPSAFPLRRVLITTISIPAISSAAPCFYPQLDQR
jgi:hypothetical protein